MGVRFAKDFKAAKRQANGFDLRFTEGITYDLDELLSLRRRDDSTKELFIEVKEESKIGEKVMALLRENISFDIQSDLEEAKTGVEGIIMAVFKEYGCTYNSITDAIYNVLNYRIRTYLKGLSKKYDLSYTIEFADSPDTQMIITATADFSNKTALTKKFNEYYERYALELERELTEVEEGGLAISDTARRVVVKSSDYKKYLLSDEKSTSGVKENSSPSRSPVIVWEDGTPDSTIEEDIHTIHDELNELSDRINDTVAEVNNLEDAIDDITEIQENIESLSGLADVLEAEPDILQNLKRDVANKADSNTVYTKSETNAVFAKRTELFSGNYSDLKGTPEIPEAYDDSELRGLIGNKADSSELFSGDYNDLDNKPTIPSIEGLASESYVNEKISELIGTAPDTLDTLHEIADVLQGDNGIIETIAGKANSEDVYLKTEADKKFLTQHQSLDAYALKTELFDKDYNKLINTPTIPKEYDDGELRNLIAGKADTSQLFSGDYNDLDNKPDIPTVPTNVSAFENDAGYLTEHQSLENYALKSEIPDPYNDSELRELINEKADSEHTHDQYLTEHQSLENYALKSELFSGDYNDLDNKPTIPSIEGLASTSYVDTKVSELINSAPDALNTLGELATALNNHEDAYDALLETVGKKANSDDVYTKTDADNKFLTEHQSLEEYALKSELFDRDYNKLTNTPEIPEEYDDGELRNLIAGKADKEHTHDQYLTEHQSLEAYALKSDIPEPYNDSELRELINGKADSEHTHDQYLTEHQDISGKQDKLVSGVNIATINGQSLLEGGDITLGGSIINPDVSNKPNLTGYATEEWVNEQGFLKEIPSTVALKSDLDGKANTADLDALKSKVLAEGGAASLKLVEDISSYSALVVRGYINNNGINNRCFSFVLDPKVLQEGGLVTCTCGDDQSGLYGAIFNVEFKYTASTKTLAAARTIRHWVHETGAGTSLSGILQRVVGLK